MSRNNTRKTMIIVGALGCALSLPAGIYNKITMDSMPPEVRDLYEMRTELRQVYDSNTEARIRRALETNIDGNSMPKLLKEYTIRKDNKYLFPMMYSMFCAILCLGYLIPKEKTTELKEEESQN